MPIPFLGPVLFAGPVDHSKQEIQNVKLQNLGSNPGGLVAGDKGLIWIDSGTNEIKYWNGTAVTIVGIAGTGGPPTGAAAGQLTGTYPNPSIADGVITGGTAGAGVKIAVATITNANINAAAGIARTKLDFGAGLINADIAAAAGIALNKLATDPLDRTNHTGTQPASSISNFVVTVQTVRLDQMAAPTTTVNFNGQRAINGGTPSAGTDLVTKDYADGLRSGISLKDPVRFEVGVNINLASPGATLDGIAMSPGESALLTGQTDGTQNGIYVWNGAAVPMTRRPDADSSVEMPTGTTVWVSEGTEADSRWTLATNGPIVLGTTVLTFTRDGGLAGVTAGAGLTKTANVIDVGGGTGITINADGIQVAVGGVGTTQLADASVTGGTAGAGVKIAAGTITDANIHASAAIARSKLNFGSGLVNADIAAAAAIDVTKINGALRKVSFDVGNGAATSIVLPHNLNTLDLSGVFVRQNAGTRSQVFPEVQVTDANNVTLVFLTAPTAAQYRCIISG